jgi:hypothetical protein
VRRKWRFKNQNRFLPPTDTPPFQILKENPYQEESFQSGRGGSPGFRYSG